MIQKYLTQLVEKKEELINKFLLNPPQSYQEILKEALKVISFEDSSESPDPKRIHEIDDGDYQGTLVFVIGDSSYQPDRYFLTKVSYGSCSFCDTLQSILDNEPGAQQAEDFYTLALHMIEKLKEV